MKTEFRCKHKHLYCNYTRLSIYFIGHIWQIVEYYMYYRNKGLDIHQNKVYEIILRFEIKEALKGNDKYQFPNLVRTGNNDEFCSN
jgi:hypothetical protein